MHEYSIVQSLLDRVQVEVDARGAVAVHRLRVKIGEFSGVEIELLKSAYDLFRQRTICESAELDLVPVAGRWACPSCQRTIRRGEILRCIDCDAPAKLIEGSEIILERLEMEVA